MLEQAPTLGFPLPHITVLPLGTVSFLFVTLTPTGHADLALIPQSYTLTACPKDKYEEPGPPLLLLHAVSSAQ